ncbi:diacylglycerol kinase family lipid kinase [Terribacillus saccharophilus]|uniref:diacylglycerol/lipid kinase family protein n=1 Tax=Terribacillus saccharophilus TaxID=361277 RepID=UPI0039822114
MLIINPSSGKEKALQYEEQAVAILGKRHELVVVKYTEKEGDATDFAASACDGTYETLLAMGGDGTINECISGLAEKEQKPNFAFVPLGTVNDFARALQIPRKPKQALALLEDYHLQAVDIGKVEDRYFMNVLAVGVIAEAVYDVTPELKSKYGHFAYLFEGAKAFREKTPFHLHLRTDEEEEVYNDKSYMMLVALTSSVAGFEKFAQQAEVDDHLFHVFILEELSVQKTAKLIPDILTGKLAKNEQVAYFKVKDLQVASDTELVVNIDGDEGIPLPFKAKVLPGEIKVVVPKKA